MKNAKHTPGEWKAVYQRQPLATNHWAVETIDGRETPCGWIFTEANARLIASAPDLLEACKEAEAILSIQDGRVKELLQRAIAKAEGK